jgi:hypothetical protein
MLQFDIRSLIKHFVLTENYFQKEYIVVPAVPVSVKISDVVKARRKFLWHLSLTYWHVCGREVVHTSLGKET